MTDEQWMHEAVEMARRGVDSGQTPFGACLVRDAELVAAAHNCVWGTCDPTAHAEVRAIRQACEKLGSIDLSGCVMYSTCEPCPMCFAAIHWAKVSRVVFGARIADAAAAGFSELAISNEQMKSLGSSAVEIAAGCLRDECVRLLQDWSARPDRRTY